MATVELTEDTFDATLDKGGIVLVDWWASWCGPCRAFAPVYEKVSAKHPDVVFGKVDTDEERGLAGHYEIRSIPTLSVFRDGLLLFSEAGMVPASTLEDLIAQARGLDMEDVRRKIADDEGGSA